MTDDLEKSIAAVDAAIVHEVQFRTLPQGRANDQAERNLSSTKGTPLLLDLIEARRLLVAMRKEGEHDNQ